MLPQSSHACGILASGFAAKSLTNFTNLFVILLSPKSAPPSSSCVHVSIVASSFLTFLVSSFSSFLSTERGLLASSGGFPTYG